MAARHRWARLLVTIFAALALAALANLSLCLLFSYRSTAYGSRTWFHLVGASDRLAQATHYESLGKTIQFWKPIYPADITEFRTKGTFEGNPATLGPEQPPAWSAFWDDRAFEHASHSGGDFGDHRHDIAVGWPWRAFSCFRDHDDDSGMPVTRGGIPLADLMIQHPANFVGEIRVIPLRPMWRGIALNTLALWLPSVVAVFLVRRFLAPAIALARAARANAPSRPPRSRARHLVVALAFLLLGLLTAGIVTIVLPLSLYARVVNTGATDRMDTSFEADLWWRRRSTQLSLEESQDQSPAAARALISSLRSLHYTGDTARQLRTPGSRYANAEFFANRRIFGSIETGQPFIALWGAQWVIGNSGRASTGIATVPRLSGPLALFSRGLREFPKHIVWFGWAANTAFYALLWFLLFRTMIPLCRGARAAARIRRGHCVHCNYDLHATPPGSPCPECGSTRPHDR